MAKSDKDHALQLFAMAKKDHQALSNMLNPNDFTEEIFGFHAQQAIEKALKAWIAVLGRTYPKSHDVGVLVAIIRHAGGDLSKFPDLEDYTPFAVQYRYEAYDEMEEVLDRDEAIQNVGSFLIHVQRIIDFAN
jgi:hypothetical protein